MERRHFIRVLGVGTAGTLLLPALLTGCQSSEEQRVIAQKYLNQENGGDPRLLFLAYAMQAANPHNIQPWLVRLDGTDALELFVDQERLLPHTDPIHRQIHIGQGTFLENLLLAAKHYGYRYELVYFPQGEYSNQELKPLPVARVMLTKDDNLQTDPLFHQIGKRQSTKTLFDTERAIDSTHLAQLSQQMLGDTGLSLHFTQTLARKNQLRDIIRNAMAVEVSKEERHLETWRMFRFSQEELTTKRDGFGYANNGVTGIKRVFAEWLYSREKARPLNSSWAMFPIQQHYDMADSASAFGWIVSNDNSRLTQVRAGQLYERINLQAAELGLAMHPHSQVIQEYDDMLSLQKHFRQTLAVPAQGKVQMLFRLGYADPVTPTLRRPLNAIILS